MVLGLEVDVCTYDSLLVGVPNLFSDTWGLEPFFPGVGGRRLQFLPLPTLDEGLRRWMTGMATPSRVGSVAIAASERGAC